MQENEEAVEVASFPLHFLCADPLATADSVAHTIACYPSATVVVHSPRRTPAAHVAACYPSSRFAATS